MKFSMAGDVDSRVIPHFLRVAKRLREDINNALVNRGKSNADFEICFSPTILDPELGERYLETGYDSAENVLYYCPEIDFNAFKRATDAERRSMLLVSLSRIDAVATEQLGESADLVEVLDELRQENSM